MCKIASQKLKINTILKEKNNSFQFHIGYMFMEICNYNFFPRKQVDYIWFYSNL